MDGWANGQKYWTNGPSWPDYHRIPQDAAGYLYRYVLAGGYFCHVLQKSSHYRSHRATEVMIDGGV